MHRKIVQYLDEIEKREDIKILLASEAGSTAYGFPSNDSHLHVKIIYIHKENWYLSFSEKKDSIDLMFENGVIHITGWDIKKSLKLLRESYVPLLEHIKSQIIYTRDNSFLKEINEIASSQYSRINSINHYLSIALFFLDEFKEKDRYKLKNFLKSLRSAIACKWILEMEEIPPTNFQEMIDVLNIKYSITKRIKELILLSSTVSYSYLHSGETELITFIESSINLAKEKRISLPPSKGTRDELNVYFLKLLVNYG